METKRTQSPDYPAISLKEAVDRCRRLYNQVQTHPAPRHIIAQGLGFNTMHGGAMSAMAAARKYGLLTKQGDTLRLSDLAKQILFPKSDDEKAAALEEAALKPALFSDLYQTFGPNPPSEMLLTNHLVRAGFLANAAKLAINSYQDSLPFVRGSTVASDDADEYDSNSELEVPSSSKGGGLMPAQQLQERPASGLVSVAVTQPPSAAPAAARDGERRLFDYDFEADGGVGVTVRGNVDTEEALDVIQAWIGWKRQELARKSKGRTLKIAQPVTEADDETS